jgi:hypothetical protein
MGYRACAAAHSLKKLVVNREAIIYYCSTQNRNDPPMHKLRRRIFFGRMIFACANICAGVSF